MLVKFYSPADGGWLFGKYNASTKEMILPSGYALPVIGGYVFYRGHNCQVLDVNNNPVE